MGGSFALLELKGSEEYKEKLPLIPRKEKNVKINKNKLKIKEMLEGFEQPSSAYERY